MNILISARRNHEIIGKVLDDLQNMEEFNAILVDPMHDHLDLEQLSTTHSNIDAMVVKVWSDISIDLLYYAKLYQIPTLHDIDAVLLCKNKLAMDLKLRKILFETKANFPDIKLPNSWIYSLRETELFKKWAVKRLPIVIKSHYQHNLFMRFNFLAQKPKEIDKFRKMYANFLSYDMYIQKFIECDGMDRKVYVIGNKVFGVKRENPIYLYLKKKPKTIDTAEIKRYDFELTEELEELARYLGKELNLKLFGFDLVKPLHEEGYYLIDINDFPGFRGVPEAAEEIVHLIKFFLSNLKST